MNILVTGGSRGIGAAISKLFKERGHYVYAPSREELNLIKPIKLSQTNFDVVINNGGINPLKKIDDIFDTEVMTINYQAPLSIIQQCLPYMLLHKYGRIINIGSIWIELSKPQRLAYSASKNALHSLTKSIVSEYGNMNILANTISPGFIGTELTYNNNSDNDINKILNTIPLKRLGYPEEVALLTYQLTIENNYIAGQNIIIDGGFSCSIL